MVNKCWSYPLFSLLLSLIFFSCNQESLTIDVYSYQIDDPIEKKSILDQYLKNQSGLIDAEYSLWYQDNSTGFVPGPSDYLLKFALKVLPDSIDGWIEGLELSTEILSISNWDDLKLDSLNWKYTSSPEYYHSRDQSEIKLLFRKDSIILARYSSQ